MEVAAGPVLRGRRAPVPSPAVVFLAAVLFALAPGARAAEAWSAEWIWGPGEENAVNIRRHFRGSFALDSAPESASISIASSGPYVLWVNGTPAGRGPERSFPGSQSYDERQIGRLLRPGLNCVAILSEHAGVRTSSSVLTRPGLLVQLAWRSDSGPGSFGSSGLWRTIPGAAWSGDAMRISPMRGFLEIFDARLLPGGWNAPGFDDSGWGNAVSLGKPPVSPWSRLVKRESPFPVEERLSWKSVIGKGSVREHGVLAEIAVPGDRPPSIAASFDSGKPESWTMELRSLHSASCYLDGSMVPGAKSGSSRHFVWRLDVPAGKHVLFVGISGPPPGGYAAFHLSKAGPLAGAEWLVSGKPAKAAFVGRGDVARYNGVENDGFEESASAVSVSRSRRITMRPAADGRVPAVVLDFGREVSGRPFLDLKAAEGTVVDLSYAEVLDEGMPNPFRGGVRHADRYVCRKGVQSWEAGGKRAFRFMRITMRNLRSEAAVISAGVKEERMPFRRAGSFESSDPDLNRIWKVCLRTLDLCTEDAFIDCPWRERALWVSDLRVEALSHYVTTGDASLPRRCLFLLAGGMGPDGLFNGVAPSDSEARLEEGGLLWILSLDDYFRMTGDLSVFEGLEENVRKALGWYEQRRNGSGLLEYRPRWIHIDWENRLKGPEMGRYSGGPSAALNALYAGALASSARLYAAAGGERRSAYLSRQAAQTAEALNSLLWSEEKGVFADELIPGRGLGNRVSQQANVLCLLYARPGPKRAGRILRYILDERNEMALVGTPYFMHYFFSALAKAGLGDTALSMLERQWGWMLGEGATCFWETFGVHPGWSACHGWSAHPLYFFANDVLGVKPAAPGYSRILLDDFGGGPEKAGGKVAVPGGEVSVVWKRAPGRVELRAALPAGRDGTARLRLGDCSNFALWIDGRRAWAAGEAPVPGVKVEDGRVEVSLGPGARVRLLLEKKEEAGK